MLQYLRHKFSHTYLFPMFGALLICAIALSVGNFATGFFTFMFALFIAAWPTRDLYRSISTHKPDRELQ